MKILSIVEQKQLTTYPNSGIKCCIIMTCQKGIEWYNTKFIQLYSYLSQEYLIKTEYKGSNYQKDFYKEILDFDFVLNMDVNIIDLIIQYINDNKYIEIMLDSYFVKGKLGYKRYQFFHVTLVYGYDIVKKEIYTIAFKNDRDFGKLTISFDDFSQAYLSYKKANPSNIMFISMSISSSLDNYSYCPKTFIDELKEYLYCIRFDLDVCPYFVDKYSNVFKFGTDIYMALKESIVNPEFRIKFQSIHMFAEHKRELLKKIIYYCTKTEISESTYRDWSNEYLENVVKKSEILRMLYLKRKEKNNGTEINLDYKDILDRLEPIAQYDKVMLSKIFPILIKGLD